MTVTALSFAASFECCISCCCASAATKCSLQTRVATSFALAQVCRRGRPSQSNRFRSFLGFLHCVNHYGRSTRMHDNYSATGRLLDSWTL